MKFKGFDDGFEYDQPPVSPLGNADALMHDSVGTIGPNPPVVLFIKGGDKTNFPENRIYIDQDLSGFGSVAIPDSYHPLHVHPIANTGVDGGGRNYVEVDLWVLGRTRGMTKEQAAIADMTGLGFNGFLTGATALTGVITYVVGGSLNRIDRGAEKNSGQCQRRNDADHQRRPDDVATRRCGTGAIPSHFQLCRACTLSPSRCSRRSASSSVTSCASARRAHRASARCRTTATAELVDDDHVIDRRSIVTPGQGYGRWPGWETLRDGLVSMVEIQDGYDYRSDDWTLKLPVFQDPDTIATHKGRGKALMKIAPYSFPPPGGVAELSSYEQVAVSYLSTFGEDYAVITFVVPRTQFESAVRRRRSGVRHGAQRRWNPRHAQSAGLVIRRFWSLSSTSNSGELDVLVYLQPTYGYTPAGWVTDQTDNGSNSWTLTLDPTHELNLEWSSSGDGRVLDHFADGMFIELRQHDTTTPTVVTASSSVRPMPDPET